MRKYTVKVQAISGLPPGVYLIDLSDGIPPTGTVDAELLDADFVLKRACGDSAAKSGFNVTEAAEKIAPAIASLAMRWL